MDGDKCANYRGMAKGKTDAKLKIKKRKVPFNLVLCKTKDQREKIAFNLVLCKTKDKREKVTFNLMLRT